MLCIYYTYMCGFRNYGSIGPFLRAPITRIVVYLELLFVLLMKIPSTPSPILLPSPPPPSGYRLHMVTQIIYELLAGKINPGGLDTAGGQTTT